MNTLYLLLFCLGEPYGRRGLADLLPIQHANHPDHQPNQHLTLIIKQLYMTFLLLFSQRSLRALVYMKARSKAGPTMRQNKNKNRFSFTFVPTHI